MYNNLIACSKSTNKALNKQGGGYQEIFRIIKWPPKLNFHLSLTINLLTKVFRAVELTLFELVTDENYAFVMKHRITNKCCKTTSHHNELCIIVTVI